MWAKLRDRQPKVPIFGQSLAASLFGGTLGRQWRRHPPSQDICQEVRISSAENDLL